MEAAVLSAFVRDPVISALLAVFLLALAARAQDLTFETLEEKSPGLLGNIVAKANLTSVLGQKELRSLQYAVLEDSRGGNSLFYVDQMTGDLSTTTTLDRERLCGSAAVCTVSFNVAVQYSESAFFRNFSVVVHVLDVNDNSPEFENPTYSKTLTEEAQRGSTVLVLVARDTDEGDNARVSYFLADSAPVDVKNLFALNRDTGALTLLSSLNNRGGMTFTFDVVARDNGVPRRNSECKVTIEVLDTRNGRPQIEVNPFFSRHGAAVVPESAAIGRVTALLTVKDHDSGRNGLVTCQLDNAFFSLQKLELNEYKVIVAASLDRERQAKHYVFIRCSDGGDPPLSVFSELRVEVSDINDNSPEFENPTYSKTLTEEAQRGSTVLVLVARDTDEGDNARVSYFLADSAPVDVKNLFALNRDTGALTLLSSPNNRGGMTFRFDVVARDNGVPRRNSECKVTIEVLDTRNGRPQIEVNPFFSRHGAAVVPESAAIGRVTALLRVKDHDSGRNGLVTCQLDNAFFSLQMLELNEYKVIVAASLDRERQANHSVSIRCRDGGDPPLSVASELRVEVSDINDNSPEL